MLTQPGESSLPPTIHSCLERLSNKRLSEDLISPKRNPTSRQNGVKNPYFALLHLQRVTIQQASSPLSDGLWKMNSRNFPCIWFSEVRIQMPQKEEEEFVTVPALLSPMPQWEPPSKVLGPLPSQRW